jgi:thiamine-phosphate pyrophosphorylase
VTGPPRLVLPGLYAILDVDACARAGCDPRRTTREFLDGGARLLQLRAKGLPGGAMLDLARFMIDAARQAGAMVIVNDRADIARLAAAAGVHVGQDDLPADAARRLMGAAAIVGVSTHAVAQVRAAIEQPVDYIAIGPVFATATKDTGYEAVGLAMVAEAASLAGPRGIPVVAIGGITLATAPSVLAAGAASVAVIGDLLHGEAAGRVRAFQSVL